MRSGKHSNVFLQSDFTHVFIGNDAEDAQYIQNDLQNLLEKKEVLFLPSSYKKAYSFKTLQYNLNDSIFTDDKEKVIAELEEQYQSEKNKEVH